MIRPWEEHGWEEFGCRKIPFLVNGRSYVRDVWIETGTDSGFTTAWAWHNGFSELHTIDINPRSSDKVRHMFATMAQIHVHCGDSRDVLPHVIDPNRLTTFFLDAHYQLRDDPNEMAPGCQCPLLDELKVITSVEWKHLPLIIIDDSVCFRTATIPQGFTKEQWPTTDQIFPMLSEYVISEIEQGSTPNYMFYCFPKED